MKNGTTPKPQNRVIKQSTQIRKSFKKQKKTYISADSCTSSAAEKNTSFLHRSKLFSTIIIFETQRDPSEKNRILQRITALLGQTVYGKTKTPLPSFLAKESKASREGRGRKKKKQQTTKKRRKERETWSKSSSFYSSLSSCLAMKRIEETKATRKTASAVAEMWERERDNGRICIAYSLHCINSYCSIQPPSFHLMWGPLPSPCD